jgi:hypothetical protein
MPLLVASTTPPALLQDASDVESADLTIIEDLPVSPPGGMLLFTTFSVIVQPAFKIKVTTVPLMMILRTKKRTTS